MRMFDVEKMMIAPTCKKKNLKPNFTKSRAYAFLTYDLEGRTFLYLFEYNQKEATIGTIAVEKLTAIARYSREPLVVLVRTQMRQSDKRLPATSRKLLRAGFWSAIKIVLIRPKMKRMQKKPNVINTSSLNPSAKSEDVLSIFDQLRNGLTTRNTINAVPIIMLRNA